MLHHTGYRVARIDRSIELWTKILGAQIEMSPTLISADSVVVCFLRVNGGLVELVAPLDTSGAMPPSVLGGRPDHICFLCADFDRRVATVRDQGGLVVRAPVGSEAFGGKRMCFVLYRDVGLVEWVER